MGTKSFAGVLAASLVLAGCGAADGDESQGAKTGSIMEEKGAVSVKDIASRAKDLAKPQPGLYRSSLEIVKVDIPDAPPQIVDMLKGTMESAGDSEYCMTPEDAENGYREMVRNSQQGDCDYQRFDVTGNKFDAVMTCKGQNAEKVRVTLSGTGRETSSDMDMTMDMNIPGLGDGTIRMRSHNERIGPCKEG